MARRICSQCNCALLPLLVSDRTGKNTYDKRSSTVARTLKILNGCVLQQKAAMGTQAGNRRGGVMLAGGFRAVRMRGRWWRWWLWRMALVLAVWRPWPSAK